MATEFKNFQHLAFDYVSKLQEVNETKKFELVEIVSFLLSSFHNSRKFVYCCNFTIRGGHLDKHLGTSLLF